MSEHTEEFIQAIKEYVDFWDRQDRNSKEKLEGIAFSILFILDGISGNFEGDITSLEKEWDGMIHETFYKNGPREGP